MTIKEFLNMPYSRTYPKKRWLITILIFSWIILGALFGAILNDNVKGLTNTLSTSFEDGVLGNLYSNTWITSWKGSTGTFQVDNSYPHTGTKDIKIVGSASFTATMNLTYTTGYYLTCFSFWVFKVLYDVNPITISFKNLSSGSTLIELQSYSNYFRYKDWTGGIKTLGGAYSDTVKTLIGFTVIDNQTVQYYNESSIHARTTISDTPRTITTNNSYWHIDQISFSGTTTTGDNLYIDDFNLTYSDGFSGTGTGLTCGYDMSPYVPTGQLANNYVTASTSHHIFENYIVPISTTVKGIELAVDISQYTIDSNLNNYHLSVNGLTSTIPDCFYQKDSGTYILFWSENIVLSNQTMSLNFTHDTLLDSNHYWYQCIGTSGEDLDFDGDAVSGEGLVSHQVCNWIWFNNIPYYVCTDVYTGGFKNYDLSYRFYHTAIQSTNIYNYTDLLGLYGWSYKNSTGYIYDLNDESPIICSYTLGDPSYSYTIHLFKDGIEILNSDFPYSCSYPSGTVGYSPNITGTYLFQLQKVNAVYNITAYVIGSSPTISLKTQPSITDIGQQYTVLYKYSHPQGYDGVICLFNNLNEASTYSKNVYSYSIYNNSDSSFTYDSISSSVEYWRIFINKNGQYFPIGHIATHLIRIPNIVDNTINCNVYTIEIANGNPVGKSVIITGHHTLLGADVYVYVGGVKQGYVGDSQEYTYFFNPIVSGVFTVELRLIQNGTSTTLCSTPQPLTVIVSSVNNTLPPENPLDTYGIPVVLRIPLGIGLAMLFLCIPLIVQIKSHSEVNIFIYLFFGLLGLIIATVIGLLPVIIVGVIILILVLIIIVMWLRNKQG